MLHINTVCKYRTTVVIPKILNHPKDYICRGCHPAGT